MKKLIPFLGLKAFFAILIIFSGIIGLGPDEAQYWTWSQQLDWGYYSKPPGIAWQIWLGTQVFGNTELGVRLMAVVINFLIPLAIYYLARSCRLKDETAFWAAICFAFSPLGILGSLLATTDGGLVLFWTLSCIVITKSLSRGSAPNYPLLGLAIAGGALFKWPIYILWIFVLLAMIPFSHLRTRSFFLGVAVSLLGLLPSIIWNAQHDWATFQHVFSTMKGGHAHTASSGNFWDFIGAQAALVSPVLFILLLMAIVAMLRQVTFMWPSVLFCGSVTTLLLTVYSLLALKQKMQGNWVVFAYPTGMVLLAWYALEQAQWGKKWLKGGVIFSVVLSMIALSLPFSGLLPFKANPFKHNLGWVEMEEALAEIGYEPENAFVFGDKYQMSSLLSFYSPEQKRAYFLNLQGARKNQFSYWPSMADEQMGKVGYYVLAENTPQLEQLDAEEYRQMLEPYFSEVEVLGLKPLIKQNGRTVKGLLVIKCLGYEGKETDRLDLY